MSRDPFGPPPEPPPRVRLPGASTDAFDREEPMTTPSRQRPRGLSLKELARIRRRRIAVILAAVGAGGFLLLFALTADRSDEPARFIVGDGDTAATVVVPPSVTGEKAVGVVMLHRGAEPWVDHLVDAQRIVVLPQASDPRAAARGVRLALQRVRVDVLVVAGPSAAGFPAAAVAAGIRRPDAILATGEPGDEKTWRVLDGLIADHT